MQLTRHRVILYTKSRATNVEISVSNESWITDLQINTFIGQMVIISNPGDRTVPNEATVHSCRQESDMSTPMTFVDQATFISTVDGSEDGVHGEGRLHVNSDWARLVGQPNQTYFGQTGSMQNSDMSLLKRTESEEAHHHQITAAPVDHGGCTYRTNIVCIPRVCHCWYHRIRYTSLNETI